MHCRISESCSVSQPKGFVIFSVHPCMYDTDMQLWWVYIVCLRKRKYASPQPALKPFQQAGLADRGLDRNSLRIVTPSVFDICRHLQAVSLDQSFVEYCFRAQTGRCGREHL